MKKTFKYFVLLADMRTGSNLFEENIRHYSDFSSHGELFNPHFIGTPKTKSLYSVSIPEREKKPLNLLSRLIEKETDTIPGFRLFSDHDHRVLNYCLADDACAKIVLTRNPLDSFVSHAIARATDQWKLTDLHKRKEAVIDFDILAFRSHLKNLKKFADDIQSALQRSGQTAFHITFDDLNDVEVFNGVSRFLGSEEQLKNLNSKIKRQNPANLREKVRNYEEMVAQVKTLDLFSMGQRSYLEPERNAGVPKFLLGSKAPVMFLPIGGSLDSAVGAWMVNLNGDAANVISGIKQKDLNIWRKSTQKRLSFTVLENPVARAYQTFEHKIFRSGEGSFKWIREVLVNNYKITLPAPELTSEPNRRVLENSGYDVNAHRAAFLDYLKFIKGNLMGQTRARVDQSWATQTAIVQGFSRAVIPDLVIRPEDIVSSLEFIEKTLGLVAMPKSDKGETDLTIPLNEIYDATVEAAVREVYARDYLNFGFANWQ